MVSGSPDGKMHSNPFSMGNMSIAMSDMTNVGRSVVVDLIMVQVIALALGAFLLIIFEGYKMSPSQLAWTMGSLFAVFMMAGMVYRRLSS